MLFRSMMELQWHKPQSLFAELTLCAVAFLVYIYRLTGGNNEWLRTHGIILVTYYAVGGIAYDELEGWPLLDATYFLTVTITTVGYGDLCPETSPGKLFTVFYAIIGIVFVFAALSPLVDFLLVFKNLLLTPCTPPEVVKDASLTELRAGGHWGFKYGSALAGPFIIFVLGLVIGFFIMGLNLVDGIYWSMITMTCVPWIVEPLIPSSLRCISIDARLCDDVLHAITICAGRSATVTYRQAVGWSRLYFASIYQQP